MAARIPEKAFAEQWQSAELAEDIKRLLGLDLPIVDWAAEEGIDETGIRERIVAAAEAAAAAKAAQFGPELNNYIEKSVLLQTLDHVWKEHLLALDYLRQGIGLRSYGQRDPLNEYKREAFALFNGLLDELRQRVTNVLAHVTVAEAPPAPRRRHRWWRATRLPGGMTGGLALAEPVVQAAALDQALVGEPGGPGAPGNLGGDPAQRRLAPAVRARNTNTAMGRSHKRLFSMG